MRARTDDRSCQIDGAQNPPFRYLSTHRKSRKWHQKPGTEDTSLYQGDGRGPALISDLLWWSIYPLPFCPFSRQVSGTGISQESVERDEVGRVSVRGLIERDSKSSG